MARSATFDDLLKKAQREKTITVYLDDDLARRVEELEQRERILSVNDPDSELPAVRDDLAQARLELAEHAVEMRFRGISKMQMDRLIRRYPATDDQRKEWRRNGLDGSPPYDFDKYRPALVAATLVEPHLSEDEVLELWDSWNSGDTSLLFDAAADVCLFRRDVDIPKDSATTADTESKSPPQ